MEERENKYKGRSEEGGVIILRVFTKAIRRYIIL